MRRVATSAAIALALAGQAAISIYILIQVFA
jgi:hypothetical protein